MRRYQFLTTDAAYQALNNVRNAFLAAHNGQEVEEIIKAILTPDEQLKIGRRIEIASYLKQGSTFAEIVQKLNVGRSTAIQVEKMMDQHPQGFLLIASREQHVESEFHQKALQSTGSSKLWHKPKVYTGFKRKDVKR